jgi:DNA invertase Pin-like site-specific DNA recombinase
LREAIFINATPKLPASEWSCEYNAKFRAMMTDASRRRFDVLVVWALDRLSRDGVPETFDHIRNLTRYGVEFVSFAEAHFRTTGPAGEFMIAVAAWIAKQERVRISERVRAGLSRAKAQGTKSGRPVGRPRVIFHRDEAIELRSSGLSWPQIARKLRVGVTTVRRACQDESVAAKTLAGGFYERRRIERSYGDARSRTGNTCY